MSARQNKTRIRLNTDELVDRLAEAMVAADILGRVRVLREAQMKGFNFNASGPLASGTFGETLGYESVAPSEAMDFVRSLTSFTKAAWKKLAPQYRQAAFTVAHVESIALLDTTQELLSQALEEGWTKQQFIEAMNGAFDRAGVTRLNPYHADLVFEQNMATAYANGRFQQMSDPDVVAALPYWRYRTAEDDRVRPNHAALERFTARQSDTIWGLIYPPNGFNCRCLVEPLLASEGSAEADVPGVDRLPAGGRPDPGFDSKPGVTLRQLASGKLL